MNIQKKILAGSLGAIAIAALFSACSTATVPEFPDECALDPNSEACLASGDVLTMEDQGIAESKPITDKDSTKPSSSGSNTESSGTDKGENSDQGESYGNSDSDSSSDSDSDSGSDSSSDSDSDSSSSDETSDEGKDPVSSSDSDETPSSSDSQEPSQGTSSSSSTPAESSSSAVLGEETIMVNENTASVGVNNMEKVSESEASELDAWREAISNGESVSDFELSDKLNFGYTDMDFDNYVYYCFTGDNEWLRIPFDNLKESGLPFLWNGAAWGLQRKYSLRFEDACAAIYVQRKQ